MKVLAYSLLIGGVALAGAGGARMGDGLTQVRQAEFAASLQDGDQAPSEAVSSPKPMERWWQWMDRGGWTWGAGVGLVVVGAGLARRSSTSGPSASLGGTASELDLKGTIAALTSLIDELQARLSDTPLDADCREERDDIDRAFEKYISPVIDARQRLSDRFGATKYSVIIGHFAAGERNLARSWSALTDGRADVAREALKKSRNAFEEALREVS